MAPPQSIWALKPWWCQPWSILISGVSAPVASWWLLHRWWITAPLAAGVLVWWWLFLVLVPAGYSRWRQEQDTQAAEPGDSGSPDAEAPAAGSGS